LCTNVNASKMSEGLAEIVRLRRAGRSVVVARCDACERPRLHVPRFEPESCARLVAECTTCGTAKLGLN
jgi:hypothetical protein